VIITHPVHPLRGQRVEIVRVRRGTDPDLIIRLPDGRHIAIAASWTDYHGPADAETALPIGLLDIAGLRQMARLIECIRSDQRVAPCIGRESSYDG
jgi:hypothetical protein